MSCPVNVWQVAQETEKILGPTAIWSIGECGAECNEVAHPDKAKAAAATLTVVPARFLREQAQLRRQPKEAAVECVERSSPMRVT